MWVYFAKEWKSVFYIVWFMLSTCEQIFLQSSRWKTDAGRLQLVCRVPAFSSSPFPPHHPHHPHHCHQYQHLDYIYRLYPIFTLLTSLIIVTIRNDNERWFESKFNPDTSDVALSCEKKHYKILEIWGPLKGPTSVGGTLSLFGRLTQGGGLDPLSMMRL